jgi:CBS domain-containing protein
MEMVRQLLKKKGHHIWSIGPDASVYEALELMSKKEIGALVVMEFVDTAKGARILGVVSERDYARNVILKGRLSKDTRVREIMTTRVVHAHPDHSVQECMEIMTEKRVRHLPVLEEGSLLGVISIGDLVKSIMSEQQFMIEQLEHYITG